MTYIRSCVRRVFVSGCFDLLHTGHLEFLEFARAQGDYLIVSIASDETIRALKREPIIGEHDRYLMVRALRCVDECFISRGKNDNDDCLQYVKNFLPDIWVVNYTDQNLAKKVNLAEQFNIGLVYNNRPEGNWSTTHLIEKIKCSV